MQGIGFLAIALGLGLIACGPVDRVEEDVAEQESAVVLTDRALRFNLSGNCVRVSSGALKINTCPTPSFALWTFHQINATTYLPRTPDATCIRVPDNPFQNIPLQASANCTLGATSERQWRVRPGSGSLDITFQLESVRYPGQCMHENTNTYGVVQNLVLKTCLTQEPTAKQRLFLD